MQNSLSHVMLVMFMVLLIVLIVALVGCFRNKDRTAEEPDRVVGGAGPPLDEPPLQAFQPADATIDSQRSVTLQFRVKEGDSFRFECTFSTQPKRHHYTERIVKVTDAVIHVTNPDDSDPFIDVGDSRGYSVDFLDLKSWRSIKDQLPEDVWDIYNWLILPDHSVKIGDTWEADSGKIRVKYRLVCTGTLRGC
jgi:hypothetical protein